ncbi:putative reverse transcriptase domain-containing protein [Tanacetum coccineum]
MNIGLDLPKQILDAQDEAQKPENIKNEDVGGVGFHVMGNLILNGRKCTCKEVVTRTWDLSQSYVIATPDSIIFWSHFESYGLNLDMSTAYHPRTDGQSERTIQTLEDMLRACGLIGSLE